MPSGIFCLTVVLRFGTVVEPHADSVRDLVLGDLEGLAERLACRRDDVGVYVGVAACLGDPVVLCGSIVERLARLRVPPLEPAGSTAKAP